MLLYRYRQAHIGDRDITAMHTVQMELTRPIKIRDSDGNIVAMIFREASNYFTVFGCDQGPRTFKKHEDAFKLAFDKFGIQSDKYEKQASEWANA